LDVFKQSLDETEHIAIRLDKIQAYLTENLPQHKKTVKQNIADLFADERAKAEAEELEKQNSNPKRKSKKSKSEESSEE
jgi:hypothetical protein